MLAELERSGEEPDIADRSRQPRHGGAYTKVGVGYNIQIAVDAKNKMIVEQAVSNQVVDMGLLTQTAEPARDILEVEKIDVVADKGYFKIEDIEACEKAGMTPYVPRPQRGPRFERAFSARTSSATTPSGMPISVRRAQIYCDALRKQVARPEEVRLLQPGRVPGLRCDRAAPTEFRKVSRLENEAVLDRMAARLKTRPEILDTAPRDRRASLRQR